LQRVLTTVTLLGLLVATAAAFVITEHLKLQKSPLYGTFVAKYLSPDCGCASRVAKVRIRLRHAEHVTVAIVNSSSQTVDTIVSDELVSARSRHHWTWNGLTTDGTRAPDGSYYPWVTVARHTFQLPNRILLDTKAPKVVSVTGPKHVLLAARGRTVAIGYSFNEKAHPVVYLGSRQIILGRHTRQDSKIKWAGTEGGKPLPAGRYVLSIGAQDVVGNSTPAADRKSVTVVVRYVELAPQRITVRSGHGFSIHVTTAARRYTWRLGHRHGAHRGKTLHVRAPTTPGTYRLVVTESGQSTTAIVEVRGK
jgi:FlgD Ig-like domain